MSLHFRDAFGKRGAITESLEVYYSGHWEQEVIDLVAGIENGCNGNPPGCGDADVMHQLLRELSEEIPIAEIERDSSDTLGTTVESPDHISR